MRKEGAGSGKGGEREVRQNKRKKRRKPNHSSYYQNRENLYRNRNKKRSIIISSGTNPDQAVFTNLYENLFI